MDTHTIYFAGALFNHKDLLGNALLADAIDTRSAGAYHCVLPQNLEQTTHRACDIRDQDLKAVAECDLAILHFDGAELDSGTVVEFMMAKFLDIPSVLVRTDFRSAGDQDKDGDPWNLMCSFYPRTVTLATNGLADWQGATGETDSVADAVARTVGGMADSILGALDEVRTRPPVLKGDLEHLKTVYRWGLEYAGGELARLAGDADYVAGLVERKRRLGLL